jgi:hypothetical protein
VCLFIPRIFSCSWLIVNVWCICISTYVSFLDLKLSPCVKCNKFSFGCFPGVWVLIETGDMYSKPVVLTNRFKKIYLSWSFTANTADSSISWQQMAVQLLLHSCLVSCSKFYTLYWSLCCLLCDKLFSL